MNCFNDWQVNTHVSSFVQGTPSTFTYIVVQMYLCEKWQVLSTFTGNWLFIMLLFFFLFLLFFTLFSLKAFAFLFNSRISRLRFLQIFPG